MKAVGIIWDVDYEEDLELLPKEIEIPDFDDGRRRNFRLLIRYNRILP